MFELHPPVAYVALGLIALTAGVGWSAGCWLFGYLSRPRPRMGAR